MVLRRRSKKTHFFNQKTLYLYENIPGPEKSPSKKENRWHIFRKYIYTDGRYLGNIYIYMENIKSIKELYINIYNVR